MQESKWTSKSWEKDSPITQTKKTITEYHTDEELAKETEWIRVKYKRRKIK